MMDAAVLFPVEPLRQFFDAGGPVVVILLAASVVALAIVLVKLWHFRSLRITDLRFAEEALARYRAGRRQSAIDHAETSPNPASQALARVLRGLERGLPEDKVREEVVRYGNSTLQELRGGLRPLEVIGSLAPLLGLLGTVLGMIKAFQALELAGSRVDPAVLSGDLGGPADHSGRAGRSDTRRGPAQLAGGPHRAPGLPDGRYCDPRVYRRPVCPPIFRAENGP